MERATFGFGAGAGDEGDGGGEGGGIGPGTSYFHPPTGRGGGIIPTLGGLEYEKVCKS